MKIELTNKQAKIIINALERYEEDIWSDPGAHGFNEDDYEFYVDYEKAIKKFIEENINIIMAQIYKNVQL